MSGKKITKQEKLIRPMFEIWFWSIILRYLANSYAKGLKSEDTFLRAALLTNTLLVGSSTINIFVSFVSVCVFAVSQQNTKESRPEWMIAESMKNTHVKPDFQP